MAAKFGVFVDVDHVKGPTFYWLSTLIKIPNKYCLFPISNSHTTIELSLLLISCLS